jgi:hypothetical protein
MVGLPLNLLKRTSQRNNCIIKVEDSNEISKSIVEELKEDSVDLEE